MDENDMFGCLGPNADITEFESKTDIRAYFTIESFEIMFYECKYNQDELNELAEICINVWKDYKKQQKEET